MGMDEVIGPICMAYGVCHVESEGWWSLGELSQSKPTCKNSFCWGFSSRRGMSAIIRRTYYGGKQN